MNNENQHQVNVNHQNFLNQLDDLVSKAASAQAQIASEAAKHEFRIKFKHHLQIAMQQKAEETYSEVLQEVQEFINQFAQSAATRALDVESSTAKQIESFKAGTPQFASFSETLALKRNQQSNLLKLSDVQVNSDADKLALASLGITSDFNNDDSNNDLDAKDIEANFVTSINNDGHDRNGNGNGHE